jgi:hypothetical protein
MTLVPSNAYLLQDALFILHEVDEQGAGSQATWCATVRARSDSPAVQIQVNKTYTNNFRSPVRQDL